MALWVLAVFVFAPCGSARAQEEQRDTQQRLNSHSKSSELEIVAANVQLLLFAPDGKKTGYDPRAKKKFHAIPDSAYYEDALLAYDTGAVDLNTTQTIRVLHPQAGKYRLVVSPGTAANGEEYEVRVKLYTRNGGEARITRIAGTAERGKSSTYEFVVGFDPASVAIVNGTAGPTPRDK